jgi:hypothetical protein
MQNHILFFQMLVISNEEPMARFFFQQPRKHTKLL